MVSLITTPAATWTCLITLLAIHLAMNHAAVRAVSMHSLNRQRANLVFSVFWDEDKILTPEEVSQLERIFEWDGVLRWKGSAPLAKACIGASFQSLLGSFRPAHSHTQSTRDAGIELERTLQTFANEKYLLSYDSRHRVAHLVMKESSMPMDLLKAWVNALLLVHQLDRSYATSASAPDFSQELISTLTSLNGRWPSFVERISSAGWDIGVVNLETASGTRLRLYSDSNGHGIGY